MFRSLKGVTWDLGKAVAVAAVLLAGVVAVPPVGSGDDHTVGADVDSVGFLGKPDHGSDGAAAEGLTMDLVLRSRITPRHSA